MLGLQASLLWAHHHHQVVFEQLPDLGSICAWKIVIGKPAFFLFDLKTLDALQRGSCKALETFSYSRPRNFYLFASPRAQLPLVLLWMSSVTISQRACPIDRVHERGGTPFTTRNHMIQSNGPFTCIELAHRMPADDIRSGALLPRSCRAFASNNAARGLR